ncbi:RHS repeat-associated core domain-containing protein [Streptomyces sp. 3211]|uniref:RHS repeat-associated core domain-containing protein n=1 Tax=Streptomyces sp. 3211 TaxID=1964449 RepID=UPI0013311537|nr:RHS repeat-associated core domain-containing protein [Streptomyces sp. 3211]
MFVPLLSGVAEAAAQRPADVAGLMAAAEGVPEAGKLGGGEGGAAPDGDFSYQYPVEVPPGRKSAGPSVSLSYASSGRVHGDVAAGWRLNVQSPITVDPAAGGLSADNKDGGSPANPRNFVGPDGNPLVKDSSLPVSPGGVGYRSVNSADFTRFEYLAGVSTNFWWKAFRKDGTVLLYGRKDQHPYSYTPLVSVLDPDGHELRYTYSTVGRGSEAPSATGPREFLPATVEYRAPGVEADAPSYARVSFQYDSPAFCGDASKPGVLPVGSTLDYRFGFPKLSGTRKLLSIKTWTDRGSDPGYNTKSEYLLGYTTADSCTAGETAPFRELNSVQRRVLPAEGAGGGPKVLPPTVFTYGKAASYTKDEHYTAPVAVANLQMPQSVDTNALDQITAPGLYVAPFTTCTVRFCAVPGDGSTRFPAAGYTLAWQTSAAQASGESVTKAWLDVNGDGRQDFMKLRHVDANGAETEPDLSSNRAGGPVTGKCMVDVYVNKGSSGFVKNDGFGPFDLSSAMADVPAAGEELCSLNRSLSSDASGGFHGNPAKQCSSLPQWGAPSSWGSMQQVRHAFMDVDGDRLPELVSQPIAAVHCPYASTHGVPAPLWDSDLVPDDEEPVDSHWVTENEFRRSGAGNEPQQVTVRQANWYVYRNTGSGFETTPSKVSAGRPADTRLKEKVASVPDSGFVGSFTARNFDTEAQAVFGTLNDVTGDGFADFAVDGGYVLPGIKGGGFGDPIALPAGSQNAAVTPGRDKGCDAPDVCQNGGPGTLDSYTGYARTGINGDFNADGLPDITVADRNSNGTSIIYNTGNGWASSADGGQVRFSEDHADTKRLDTFRLQENSHDWQGYPTASERHNRTTMIDLDYDSVPDALHHRAGDRAKLYLGSGGAWSKSVDAQTSVTAALSGAARHAAPAAVRSYVERADYRHQYHLKSADINGDGLLDLVDGSNANGTVTVRYAKPILDSSADKAAPARMMRTVDNGFGAKSTVTYAYNTPAKKWVAAEVSSRADASAQLETTKHQYRNTSYVPNAYGQLNFQGFREVRSLEVGNEDIASDDLTKIALYSIDPATGDYRGSLTRRVTVLGSSAFSAAGDFDPATQTGVMAVSDHAYHVQDLGLRAPGMQSGFPSQAVLAKKTVSYTCTGATGQTANACVTSAPSSTSETTYKAVTVSGALVALVPEREETRFVNGKGQSETRRTDSTHNVAWSKSIFNIAPDTSTVTSIVNGTAKDHGVTRNVYYDDTFLQLKNTIVDDADPAIADRTTRYQYYGGTGPNRGQVYRMWAPEQIARYGNTSSAAGFTEYTYDEHGMFVVQTKNPAGHTTRSTVDPGTGAVLQSAGPNYVCPDGSDSNTDPEPPTACTFQAADAANHTELTVTDIDPLGRMLSTAKHPAGTAASTVIASASYNDDAYYNSGQSVSAATTTLAGDGQSGTTTIKMDGYGRVTRRDLPLGQFFAYEYDGRGRLTKVTSRPGNASSDDDRISIAMTHDALGRVTSVDDPGNAQPPFVVHTYDGLKHTTSQQTADGSPASQSVSFSDALGQIHTIDEKRGADASQAPLYARTVYTRDGMGNVTSVTDPDGAVTTMAHDFSGNRLSVTSAGRTWAYTYDGNSSMTKITEPVPSGKTAAAFTHTVQYDDLGRPVKETPAVRDLTAAEQTEFRTGPKDFVYDQAHSSLTGTSAYNQIGKLSSTTARDGTGAAVTTTYNRYDAYGYLQSASQSIEALNGIVSPDRLQSDYIRDAAGTTETTEYRAFTPGTSTVTNDGPAVNTDYDLDGVPTQVSFAVNGKDMTILESRNRAGLVSHRDVNTKSTSGFVKPRTTYGYDEYGRPTSITTRAAAGDTATQQYKQSLNYYDNSLIRSATEQLGAQPQQSTTYTHDHRQQLIGAVQSGGAGYFGAFTYTDGGRMKTANVGSTAAAKRLTTRNVEHVYQNPATGGDPQRLQSLRKIGDGTNLAAYTYDEAGNTTTRTLPDGTTATQRWDGSRLRKVTKPNGEKETYLYDGTTRIAAIQHKADGTLQEVRRYFGDQEVIHQPGKPNQYRQSINIGGKTTARLDGNQNTGTIEHYVTSPQGHEVLALDATTGTTQRATTYGPFGEILTELSATPTIPTGKYPKQFNGKEYDTTTNLHYYGHRYYDPLALQWTSTDPKYRYLPDAASPRNANLYTYTNNNPNDYTDPNGLEPVLTDHAVNFREKTYANGDVGRALGVEVNATNSEAYLLSRTHGPNVSVQAAHAELSVADGATAEAVLLTVNGPSTTDSASGGTWGSKVEAGFFTADGLFTSGKVVTYTDRNGLTYEAPGSGPMPSVSESDEDLLRGAMRGLVAYRMMAEAKAADRQAKLDQHDIDMANMGGRECTETENSCSGSSGESTGGASAQMQTDEHGNIYTVITGPAGESSSTGDSSAGGPLGDWQRAREGRGKL